jgi:hypothetical protein
MVQKSPNSVTHGENRAWLNFATSLDRGAHATLSADDMLDLIRQPLWRDQRVAGE